MKDKTDVNKDKNIENTIDNNTTIDGIDYVICGICGVKQQQITHAHLKTHNISFQNYLKKFPDRIWQCTKLKERMIENQIKSQYNNDKNKCHNCGKSITWNRTFCSNPCAAEFRKAPLISKNCYECGTQFYTSIKTPQKFCSRSCYYTCIKKKLNYVEKTRNKYGFQCVLCNSSKNLRVHHIDENQKNNTEDNLILLCESCHRRVHNGLVLTIYKKLTIEIAHLLPKHPTCGYLHGHSVDITVGVEGLLNLSTGMVIDFKELNKILKTIVINKFDHTCLNDTLPIPTAEFFSYYIFQKLRETGLGVVLVRVHETRNNYVEFKIK